MKNSPTAMRLSVSAMSVHPTPLNKRWIIAVHQASRSPAACGSWNCEAAQCIDRVSSRTSNGQQQKTSHDTEIFVKTFHAVDTIRTRHCPIAVLESRSPQRIKNHQHSRETHERANSDGERNRKLHEDRHGSSQ